MEAEQKLHLFLVFGSVVSGIVAVLIVFVVSAAVFGDDDDPAKTIVAIGGPIYTLIGTLVGYVAGHQLGARGREQAEGRATRAFESEAKAKDEAARAEGDRNALRGWIQAQPRVLQQARQAYPEMFQ